MILRHAQYDNTPCETISMILRQYCIIISMISIAKCPGTYKLAKRILAQPI